MAGTNLTLETKTLSSPSLDSVRTALESGLSSSFSSVNVSVVECPDLREEPWGLAAEGLGGHPHLLHVGGVPYLVPMVQRDKVYDMKAYPSICGLDSALIIGCGAAPWPCVGTNGEMMINLAIDREGVVEQRSMVATVDREGSCKMQSVPASETRHAILGDLFISQGQPSKVLEVRCRTRTENTNLITSMRQALLEGFPGLNIGLGGVFQINKSSSKIHVMPDFSSTPLTADEAATKWLKYYSMPSPMTMLSVLVTNDPGLDLKVEHTHGWGEGCGGHYHTDEEPGTVEYWGYFNLGEECVRLDRPTGGGWTGV